MSEFYRFRNIDSLLGKFQELEEQTIYFASPEELDDPMEGLRDIVWDGDKIIWTNFFKHYVFCLNRSYWLLNMTGQPQKLDVSSIPILERWDQITTPIEEILFDDIWDRFCNLPYIQEIIEVLANTRRKIRSREIIFYLKGIQTLYLLDEIRASYINHKLIPVSPSSQSPEKSSKAAGMETLFDGIKGYADVKDEPTLDVLDAFLEVMEFMSNDTMLTVQYNTRKLPAGVLEDMNRIVMPDFPKIYVEQLDRLLWSQWYTACFTGSYRNSSMWAKYADGHKGVCLIFKAVENDHSNSLKLNHKTSNSSIILPLCEVNYANKPSEIDFFQTICRAVIPTLREFWYTDQDGNISECASHIGSDGSGAAWLELYRNDLFRDATFKTKDWEYEQEYRLILPDTLSQFDLENTLSQSYKETYRKLTYDFNSLKGIIFGIRTPIEDKVKIFDLIEKKKKCDGNNRTDFKYFEAYYSAKDGEIRKREIQLG